MKIQRVEGQGVYGGRDVRSTDVKGRDGKRQMRRGQRGEWEGCK